MNRVILTANNGQGSFNSDLRLQVVDIKRVTTNTGSCTVLMRTYNAGRGENRPSPLISDKTATEVFFYLTLRCPKEFSPEAIF